MTDASTESEGGSVPDLRIEVLDSLRFSRIALFGQGVGEVELTPDGTSSYRGGTYSAGGMTMAGRARIVGQPYRAVRIELPSMITLTGAGGTRLEVRDLQTNIASQVRLDANGQFEFSFGGTLMLRDAAVSGNYRASFTIDASYE